MGAVYKAFDPLIKRTLAIKTIRLDIPRQSPQYKSFIERFYHEARISGTLSHPEHRHPLRHRRGERRCPTWPWSSSRARRSPPSSSGGTRFKPEKVISLVSQIASAVDYAHSKGVIHRDIKPVEPDPLRRRPGQGHRLRHREARRRGDDPVGHAARHAVLHVARAGDGGEARRPQRHLLARRRAPSRCCRASSRSRAPTSPRSSTSSSTSTRSSPPTWR